MNRIKFKLLLLTFFLLALCFDSSCQTSQTYTVTGLSTWTVPNCVTSVKVQVWGAGGGGGGGDIDTYSGSGGGGGGYSEAIVNVVAGTVCQLYVGAGGAGIKNGNGHNGEDSWFINKTTVLAKGGYGGKAGTIIVVGKGGAKGIGTVAYCGGDGGKAYIPIELNTSGGGGGSSAGPSSNGNNGTDGAEGLVNAPGGSAPLGGGAGGNGCGIGGAPIPDCAGFPGNAPGGGGGGGNDDIVLGSGGSGAAGQIKLTWTAGGSWFTNKTVAVCSGSTFTVAPINGSDGDRFPPGTTYSWELPVVTGGIKGVTAQTSQSVISQTLVNSSKTIQTATYLIKTSTGCNFTLIATIYSLSQLISSLTPPAVCSGSLFNYVPKGTTENLSFTWKRLAVAGISEPANSGAGSINETLTNLTDKPINVTYIYKTISNGCSGLEQNMVLTVLPLPQLSSILNPPPICSGTTFNYMPAGLMAGLTFTWARVAIDGIKQAALTGVGTINETLTNTTASSINVTYVFTTTATGCKSKTQNVVVTVNPLPQLSSSTNSNTLCSGSTFNYSPTSKTTGCVFTWNRLSASGTKETSGIGNINEIVTNTTNSPIVVTYAYTITAHGCEAKTQNVLVTVNPIPQLNNILTPITACSGTAIVFNAGNSTAGTTYEWKRSGINGILQAGSIGVSTINETLTNTTSSSINVTYVYTTTAKGCKGKEQNLMVTVNPLPQLSSVLSPPAICSGTTFNYIPASTFAAATITWSRAAISGIKQAASSGIGTINETLTNTTASPIQVTYVFTTAANGCVGKIQNVMVTVNPIPQLNSILTPVTVCSETPFSFNAGNSAVGTTYEWKRLNVSGILQAGSTGVGNINETLTNTTASSINVTYVYTPTAMGCKGKEQNLIVTVNPLPQLTSVLNPPAICSGTTLSYIPASAVPGATYIWNRWAVKGIVETNSTGSGAVNETLTNTTTSPISVPYIYTVKANGCTGKAQNVMVTVNPTPQLNSTLNPTAVCSGTAFVYTPTSATDGVTYYWSRSTIKGISQEGTKGADEINESLTNSTMYPINVIYIYTTTANNCNGLKQNITVMVNPIPQLINSTLNPPAICSGTGVNYTPASTIAGATFAWSRAAIKGIAQAASSDVGGINEVITNTGTSPVNVTYTYTATANSCKGKEQQVTVKVNPLPQLSSTLTPPAICSGTLFKYIATSATPDVHFSWKRTSVYGMLQGSSSGNGNVSELLTNTTTSPINIIYTYTTNANNCNHDQNVAVTVNPLPKATIAGSVTKCLNDAAPDILFTGGSSKPPYKFTYKINGGKNLVATSDANGMALVPASTSMAGDFTYSLLSVADSSSGLSCSQVQMGNATVKVVQLQAELLGTTEVMVRMTKPTITFKAIGGKAPYTFTYNINGGTNLIKSTSGSGTIATLLAPTNVPGDFIYTIVNIKDATDQSCASEAAATITVNPPQNSKSKGSSDESSKVKTTTISPKRLIKLDRRYNIGK